MVAPGQDLMSQDSFGDPRSCLGFPGQFFRLPGQFLAPLTTQSVSVPHCSKWLRRLSSVVSKLRPPMKSFRSCSGSFGDCGEWGGGSGDPENPLTPLGGGMTPQKFNLGTPTAPDTPNSLQNSPHSSREMLTPQIPPWDPKFPPWEPPSSRDALNPQIPPWGPFQLLGGPDPPRFPLGAPSPKLRGAQPPKPPPLRS